MNVSDFNATWITPNGVTIEAIGSHTIDRDNPYYHVLNAAFTIAFEYVTILTVTRLGYANAGIYTCSASYTVDGDSSVITGSNTIELELSGM